RSRLSRCEVSAAAESRIRRQFMTAVLRNVFFQIMALSLCLAGLCIAATAAPRMDTPAKPPLTLDAFFHGVAFSAVRMSPNGESVLIETSRPDYDHNRFRSDL